MAFVSKWDEDTLDCLKESLSNGKTLKECGELYGVSRQRIKQIIQKHNLFSNRNEFGVSKGVREREAESDISRQAIYGTSIKNLRESKLDEFKAACYEKYKFKKANSLRAGIPFTIKLDDIHFPLNCPILGIPLDYFSSGTGAYNAPTFDRVDPNGGYTKENTHIISMKANRIKSNATLQELERVYKYFDYINHMGLQHVLNDNRIIL